ncbi:putative lipoprotein YmbA [Pseudorhizobium tarimense]|uniref:Lipoprotein YmbA n=1 Tax=Pseudorhizobium tarimense TaxID=1079109 RepID=A0ABV2H5M5_9HYPH
MKYVVLIAIVWLAGCATSQPSYYQPPTTAPIYK